VIRILINRANIIKLNHKQFNTRFNGNFVPSKTGLRAFSKRGSQIQRRFRSGRRFQRQRLVMIQ
jgi:hypothetical protein